MPGQKWSDVETFRDRKDAPAIDPKFKAAMEAIAHTEPGKLLKQALEVELKSLPPKINCHGALAASTGRRSLAAYLLMCMERSVDGRNPNKTQ